MHWLMSGMRNIKTSLLKIRWNKHVTLLFDANVPTSVSGHSSEQSTAHYNSRPTVSQLKGVSTTISNWFENHRPQKTQISIITNAPFHLNVQSNGFQVDRSHTFSERNFSTPAIFKATSKLFGSLGYSDNKNWLHVSSIFFEICRFRCSILLSL